MKGTKRETEMEDGVGLFGGWVGGSFSCRMGVGGGGGGEYF